MTDPELLKTKRATFKRAVTVFANVMNTWDQTDPKDQDIDVIQVAHERFLRAEATYAPFQTELEDIETEDEKCKEVNNACDLVKVRVRKILRALEIKSKENKIININPSSGMPLSVNLPEVKLPSFDGSIENWTSFYDLFMSTIDDNSALTPVRKLQYLRLSLSDKAASCIKSLKTTGENYPIALKTLREKYSCKRRQQHRHWELIRDYPRLQRDTASNLTDLVDTLKQHISSLEDLGAPVEHWDIPLIDLITSKISTNTVYQWEISRPNGETVSYTNLLTFLGKRAKCGELSYSKDRPANESANNHYTKQKSRPATHNYAIQTNNSLEQLNNEKTPQKCPICNAPHSTYRCHLFRNQTPAEKQNTLKKHKLCFNCLSSGHMLKDCRAGHCKKCPQRHHTLLHVDSPVPESQNTGESPLSEIQSEQ